MFGSLGPTEIILLVLLALVLFGGGKRIADMGKGLGEGIKSFKQALKGDEDKETVKKEPEKKD